MNTWDAVWESRRPPDEGSSTLESLMAADGLDSGFAGLGEEKWSAGVNGLADRIGMHACHSVFEVGCGAGAFLYVLAEKCLSVGGIDRSATLVARAAEAMPRASFAVADAAAFVTRPPFDAVVSFGVFLYFASESYAELVIDRMRTKATRLVAVLDLPDRRWQREAMEYRWRLAGGRSAYAERYAGLEHRYYDRDSIADHMRRSGLIDVQVEDQSIEGYGNARYRFNAWGVVPGG